MKTDIKLLKPRGMLITDGIRQSYTDIYRIKEVEDLVSTHPNIEPWFIIGDPPHPVKSLLLVKKSEGKGLNAQERSRIPRMGCQILSLEEFKKTPLYDELIKERKIKDLKLDQNHGNTVIFNKPNIDPSDEFTYSVLRDRSEELV